MYSENARKQVYEMLSDGNNYDEISKITGISKSTIGRWKNQKTKGKIIKVLIYENRLDEARKLLERQMKKFPNDQFYKGQLIDILIKQDKLEEAEKLVIGSIDENQNNQKRKDIDKNSNDQVRKGQLIKILIKQSRIKEAEKLARDCINQNPDNQVITGQLIDILIKQNRLEEAEKLARDSIDENQNSQERIDIDKNANNQVRKGQLIMILVKQNKLEQAEELAMKEIEKNPNNQVIIGQLIDILIKQYKFEEAEKLARDCIDQNPNNQVIKWQLSKILKITDGATAHENQRAENLNDSLKEEVKQVREMMLLSDTYPTDVVIQEIDNLIEKNPEEISKLVLLRPELYFKRNDFSNFSIALTQIKEDENIDEDMLKKARRLLELSRDKSFRGKLKLKELFR